MFLQFIGLATTVLNVNNVDMFEPAEVTIDGVKQSGAVLTMQSGTVIELDKADADLVFEKLEYMMDATDKLLEQIQAQAALLEQQNHQLREAK